MGKGSIEFRDGGVLICENDYENSGLAIVPYINVTNVVAANNEKWPKNGIMITAMYGREEQVYWLEYDGYEKECRAMAHQIAQEIADRL
jgi:hypothetical protein